MYRPKRHKIESMIESKTTVIMRLYSARYGRDNVSATWCYNIGHLILLAPETVLKYYYVCGGSILRSFP
jgi:hypothetical protein